MIPAEEHKPTTDRRVIIKREEGSKRYLVSINDKDKPIGVGEFRQIQRALRAEYQKYHQLRRLDRKRLRKEQRENAT